MAGCCLTQIKALFLSVLPNSGLFRLNLDLHFKLNKCFIRHIKTDLDIATKFALGHKKSKLLSNAFCAFVQLLPLCPSVREAVKNVLADFSR